MRTTKTAFWSAILALTLIALATGYGIGAMQAGLHKRNFVRIFNVAYPKDEVLMWIDRPTVKRILEEKRSALSVQQQKAHELEEKLRNQQEVRSQSEKEALTAIIIRYDEYCVQCAYFGEIYDDAIRSAYRAGFTDLAIEHGYMARE